MSYEIIYGKQFIKLNNDRFIPLILIGSNNCYDGNKRERRWSLAFNFFNKFSYSETDIIDSLNNSLADDVDYIRIKNQSTNKNDIIKFYKNGIKKSLTIEQIIERYYNSHIEAYITHYKNYNNVEKINHQIIKDTASLEKFITDSLAYINGKEKHYITLSFYERYDTLKLRPEYKRKKTNTTEKQKNYIIKIYRENLFIGYVLKMIKTGTKYVGDQKTAKGFQYEKQALNYIQKLSDKMGGLYRFDIEKLS